MSRIPHFPWGSTPGLPHSQGDETDGSLCCLVDAEVEMDAGEVASGPGLRNGEASTEVRTWGSTGVLGMRRYWKGECHYSKRVGL